MKTFGIFHKVELYPTASPGPDQAVEAAARAAAWLRDAGVEVRELTRSCDPGELDGVEVIVVLGGDGTMLQAVSLAVSHDIPLLGVNLGNLGYLTPVEPQAMQPALERLVAGDYQIERRMTLDVEVLTAESADASARATVLNEVLLQKTASGHTIRVALALDQRPFLSMAADSVIVATPTGSTAYNFSARGPIVAPTARVQVLTPVAPHSLFDRSVIVEGSTEITVTTSDGRPAEVVIDGATLGTLQPGDAVRCREGAHDALLVSLGARHFEQVLADKFNLTRD